MLHNKFYDSGIGGNGTPASSLTFSYTTNSNTNGLDGRCPVLYPRELPLDTGAIWAGSVSEEVHAPTELQRIEHDLVDHREDLRFEQVRLYLRIAAALNERGGVHAFLRPPVTLVRRLMVDAALSGD